MLLDSFYKEVFCCRCWKRCEQGMQLPNSSSWDVMSGDLDAFHRRHRLFLMCSACTHQSSSSTVATPNCNTLLMGLSIILTSFLIWSPSVPSEKLCWGLYYCLDGHSRYPRTFEYAQKIAPSGRYLELVWAVTSPALSHIIILQIDLEIK